MTFREYVVRICQSTVVSVGMLSVSESGELGVREMEAILVVVQEKEGAKIR